MICSASFFWRNDKPGGLGFTLGPRTGWSPEEITSAFASDVVAEYFKASDAHVSEGIVETYLAQLAAIAEAKPNIALHDAILASLNIMWLAERGHLKIDEFNGPVFIFVESR